MSQHHCIDFFLAYQIECTPFFWWLVASHALQVCEFVDGKNCASCSPCALRRVHTVLDTQYHLDTLIPCSLYGSEPHFPLLYFVTKMPKFKADPALKAAVQGAHACGPGFHFLKVIWLLLLRALSGIWKGAWQELL